MSSKLRDLKTLFTSQARVQVLARLLLHTADRFYQAQIAALERLPIKAVQREIEKLLDFGLVRRAGTENGRQVYAANPDHLLYPEMKALILKSALLGTKRGRLRKEPFTKVQVAFVFGSFARADEGGRSDIDILVVGSISPMEWGEAVRGASVDLGTREENSIVMDEAEFRSRMGANERFLTSVVAGPKIFLIGGQDELNRLAQGAQASAPSPDAR